MNSSSDTGLTMGGMRLIATYAGNYGTRARCAKCGEKPEPGDRIYGDLDTAAIYCRRCAQFDGSRDG